MILALDFDGVICDSMEECLHTSYQSFRTLAGNSALPKHPKVQWQKKFREHRGFVRPSGHFFILWQWVINLSHIQLTSAIFEQLAAINVESINAFEETFHQKRYQQQRKDPQAFIDANPLYPGVHESWKDLPLPRYIVTTKDELSVRLILSAHRLCVEGVFGRGCGPKPATLCALARRHKVNPSEVIFIDDNADHIAEASAVGITAVLAEWGYGPKTPSPKMLLNAFSDLRYLSRTGNILK